MDKVVTQTFRRYRKRKDINLDSSGLQDILAILTLTDTNVIKRV